MECSNQKIYMPSLHNSYRHEYALSTTLTTYYKFLVSVNICRVPWWTKIKSFRAMNFIVKESSVKLWRSICL